MKEWYLSQNQRDQRIVIIVAALVVLGAIYALLIYPLSNGLSNRRASVDGKKETLVWMQESVAKVRQFQGSGGTITNSNKAAYVLLDEAIRNAGLSGTADRVEPAGQNKTGARVQFSQVEFDKLVRALGSLQAQYGLTVTIASISRKENGLVSARITLERG